MSTGGRLRGKGPLGPPSADVPTIIPPGMAPSYSNPPPNYPPRPQQANRGGGPPMYMGGPPNPPIMMGLPPQPIMTVPLNHMMGPPNPLVMMPLPAQVPNGVPFYQGPPPPNYGMLPNGQPPMLPGQQPQMPQMHQQTHMASRGPGPRGSMTPTVNNQSQPPGTRSAPPNYGMLPSGQPPILHGQQQQVPQTHRSAHQQVRTAPPVQVGGIPSPLQAPPILSDHTVANSGPQQSNRQQSSHHQQQVLHPKWPEGPPMPSATQAAAHNGMLTPPQTPTSPAPLNATDSPLSNFDPQSVSVFESQYEAMVDVEPVQPPSLDYKRCMQCIDENDITIVVTDTGSGKSSLLPKHILEVKPDAKVLVSQTRRTAAMALGTRVAALRGETVGDKVGYSVRGDHRGNFETTRLMYMTTYLMFLHIVNNPQDMKVDYVVLDEFHERTSDVEVTLALLRMALRRGQRFKVVLLSATMSSDTWREYFQGFRVGEFSESYAQFNVNTWYMDEISKLINLAPVTLEPQDVDGVSGPTQGNLFLYVRELVAFLASRGAMEHAILVFLPGRNEINKMMSWVSRYFPDTLDPIEWFADIELEKIREEIARPPRNNRKKIYLATDIAEVSVTVPDAVFVIDCALTKKPRIQEQRPNTVSFPPLETVLVSQSSIKQRRGRVGRVQPGFHFCLLPRAFLSNLSQPQAQIVNSVLDTLTLHVLQVCENPKTVFAQTPAQPKDASLRLSLLKLLDCGAIVKSTQRNSEAERRELTTTTRWRADFGKEGAAEDVFFTTAKGQIMQFIPLKVACCDLVFWGLMTGVPEAAVVAACIAEAGTPFYTQTGTQKPPPEEIAKTRDAMRAFNPRSNSDIVACVALVAEYKRISATSSEEAREEWCARHRASASRLEQILIYERSVLDALAEKVPGLVINPNPDTLTMQLNQYPNILDHIVGIVFAIQSIWVVHDARNAQVAGFAGNSIFLKLKALADHSSASLSTWPQKKIIVPMVLRSFGKLLGHVAVEFERSSFNMLCLCTSSTIDYQTVNKGIICRFSRQGRNKFCRVYPDVFAGVLTFRDAICAQMHVIFEHVGGVPDEDDLQEKYIERGGNITKTVTNFASLPGFICKVMQQLINTPIIDVEYPPNYAPTHRSVLHASNVSSVVEYRPEDELNIEVAIRDPEDTIED